MVATLGGAERIARAQTVAGGVPILDRLSVRMVTDNYTDRFSVPQKTPGLTVQRNGGTEKAGVSPSNTLQAEWGLSMLAESMRNDEVRRVMVDFGYSSEVLLTNMGFLGIDPASLDALVLSHGHFDHFGGLMGLLTATKDKLKPGLPLFVGGEDCFCVRETGLGGDFGVLDRPAILAAGIRLMVAEGPAIAADHAITSGQIPKTTYEDPLRVTKERTGISAGPGCDPALEPGAKNTGTFVWDDFQHEIGTSYLVKDRGLVVLTSCSHRGVLNTVKQAQAAAGTDKLHAVIGGFHLPPPLSDDYVHQTVTELKAMSPDYVIPAHCSGERFYDSPGSKCLDVSSAPPLDQNLHSAHRLRSPLSPDESQRLLPAMARQQEGIMLPRIYFTLLLAGLPGPLAAAAGAAESYDITNCSAATVTTVSSRDEVTLLNIDAKGITRSNAADKVFDNATFQCASVVKIVGTQRSGLGYCRFLAPDGDSVVGEQAFDATGGGKWKFLQGTGKWKGITGGGEFVPLTSGKPIVAGTAQGCVRATGSYELR